MSKPAKITSDLRPLLRALPKRGACAVFTHARPEGDAIGSLLALSMALEQRGVRVLRLCADPVPQVYSFMPGARLISRRLPASLPKAAVVVDCDGPARLGSMQGALDRFETVIDIDHHSGDHPFGTVVWVDPRAAAAALMIHRLLKAMRARITPAIATCLYTGILTDTGRFTNRSTNAETFDASAELARMGADPARIASLVYESRPAGSARLLGAALSRLAVRDGGRLIIGYLTRSDFAQAKAAQEDTEGIVDHLRGIRGARVAALLSEQEDGTVRVSLRSRGRVNVARVATAFGGGGHPGAAGCILPGSMQSAMETVKRALLPASSK
jgi:phosphoesterase RecJ-like protein